MKCEARCVEQLSGRLINSHIRTPRDGVSDRYHSNECSRKYYIYTHFIDNRSKIHEVSVVAVCLKTAIGVL